MCPARSVRPLSAALGGPRGLVVPGAYDALSAKLVEEAGFPVVYVGSYATAASGYAFPDVGALTLDELAHHARTVAEAVQVPVVADAEGGFFEPGSMWRTVRAFEDAGVSAIHIEDHAGGKHTKLPQRLIPINDMVQRLKAALDARRNQEFKIIARTDAIWATKDPDEAIRRVKAFSEAGIEYLFPTGATPAMLRRIRSEVPGKFIVIQLPSVRDPAEWEDAADLVIDYAFCVRVAARSLIEALALFRQHAPAEETHLLQEDVAVFERRLGYDAFTERSLRYRPR